MKPLKYENTMVLYGTKYQVLRKRCAQMARLMELGLILKGQEAEEFLKNEKSTAFTPEQISFFREAKRIYRANRSKF
jgi:hypothetical protein